MYFDGMPVASLKENKQQHTKRQERKLEWDSEMKDEGWNV